MDILFIYAAYIAEVDIWRMHTHGFGKAEIVSQTIEQQSLKTVRQLLGPTGAIPRSIAGEPVWLDNGGLHS